MACIFGTCDDGVDVACIFGTCDRGTNVACIFGTCDGDVDVAYILSTCNGGMYEACIFGTCDQGTDVPSIFGSRDRELPVPYIFGKRDDTRYGWGIFCEQNEGMMCRTFLVRVMEAWMCQESMGRGMTRGSSKCGRGMDVPGIFDTKFGWGISCEHDGAVDVPAGKPGTCGSC